MVPSRIENLPYVALEAQACSRPVVAFDVGGMRDAVVDRETGFLVQPFSVRMAVEALEAYLFLPGLRFQHGNRGRTRVSQLFGPPVVAARYTEYFRSIGDTR